MFTTGNAKCIECMAIRNSEVGIRTTAEGERSGGARTDISEPSSWYLSGAKVQLGVRNEEMVLVILEGQHCKKVPPL